MCDGVTSNGSKCKSKSKGWCRHHQPVEIHDVGAALERDQEAEDQVEEADVEDDEVDQDDDVEDDDVDQDECVVCTEPLNGQRLECGHSVHEECVLASPKKDECPMCRRKVKIKVKRAKLDAILLKKLVNRVPKNLRDKIPENIAQKSKNMYTQIYKSVFLGDSVCDCPKMMFMNGIFGIKLNTTEYMIKGEDNLVEQLTKIFEFYVLAEELKAMGMTYIDEKCDACKQAEDIHFLLNGIINMM